MNRFLLRKRLQRLGYLLAKRQVGYVIFDEKLRCLALGGVFTPFGLSLKEVEAWLVDKETLLNQNTSLPSQVVKGMDSTCPSRKWKTISVA